MSHIPIFHSLCKQALVIKSCLYQTLIIALVLGSISSLPSHAQSVTNKSIPYIAQQADVGNTIRVGVRVDAEPFSYLKPSRVDNQILPRFSGYIVEICRTVLRQMQAGEVFQGFQIQPVIVTASNRFEKLANREVDLLCGPDSITTERLRLYNVSYPVFLSGIARVKLPTEMMPRTVYCKPILGLVAGTTSEQAGIQAMAREGLFGRFEPAIKQYLKQKAERTEPPYESSLDASWTRFVGGLGIAGINEDTLIAHSGSNDVLPGSIRTRECPAGFNSGPVVSYASHAQGLQDLCAGNVLYYLGDVDIVKRNLAPGCDHIEISQQTFTKEAYGIYFRKPPRAAFKKLNEAERLDAVIYAEFNYLLVLQMQSAERLLENQYREEFGDAEMAVDLQMFFSSMQYATDY